MLKSVDYISLLTHPGLVCFLFFPTVKGDGGANPNPGFCEAVFHGEREHAVSAL